MTREEAKKQIEAFRTCMIVDNAESYVVEALNMAIEALEQEPCNTDTCKVVKSYMNEWDKPNNSDAISRQTALESIKNLYPDMPVMDIMGARRKWLEKYAPYFECENAVEHLPSVNPQPKTGHWEMCEDADGIYGVCDICGTDADFSHYGKAYPYCPNCGAKMESEERA